MKPSQNVLSQRDMKNGKTPPAQISVLLDNYGYQNSDHNMKHINYRPARLSKGKKWYVSFQYRNPKTGNFQKFRVIHGMNRIHDEKEKEEFARDLVDGVNRFLKRGGNPFKKNMERSFEEKEWTLGQSLNYFKQKLPERGLRLRTIQSYESVLRMLATNMKSVLHKPVEEIKKTHIEAAFARNKWANTSFNANLRFTRAIFNMLVESDIIDKNPAKAVKLKPETISKHRYFDDATWKKIKENAEPYLLEFILFLYHTGTRPNEARQIKYENIKGDKLLIPGTISKNRKEDYIPLSNYIIEKYSNGKGFIFGKSVTYFSQKFKKLKENLKLAPEFTLYSIKHTRAIHLAQDGATPYEIMRVFRHHSLDMTSKYLRDLGLIIDRAAAEKGLRF